MSPMLINSNIVGAEISDFLLFSPITHLSQSASVGLMSSDKSVSWNILVTYMENNIFERVEMLWELNTKKKWMGQFWN